MKRWKHEVWHGIHHTVVDEETGEAVAYDVRSHDDALLMSLAPNLLEGLRAVLDSMGALSNPTELHGWLSEQEQEQVLSVLRKAKDSGL